MFHLLSSGLQRPDPLASIIEGDVAGVKERHRMAAPPDRARVPEA
jgi:hypothetical protein